MFERLSDRSRIVMANANKEAGRLKHEYIAPEHILLGIIAEATGAGAHILQKLGGNLGLARSHIEARLEPGSEFAPRGKLPMLPSSQRVLENAILESQLLASGYAGTEHLLLGLLREQVGIAYEVLTELGVTPERARDVAKTIQGEPLAHSFQAPSSLRAVPTSQEGLAKIVDQDGNLVADAIQIELADEIVRRYNAK